MNSTARTSALIQICGKLALGLGEIALRAAQRGDPVEAARLYGLADAAAACPCLACQDGKPEKCLALVPAPDFAKILRAAIHRERSRR